MGAKKKSAIEAKNEIDSLIYSTEKSLKENEDKLDEETKKEVRKALEDARAVKDGDDLKTRTEALSKASMKVGQAIYGQQKQGGDSAAGAEEKKDDNTVDADFEEKKDDKKDGKKDGEKK